jgi:competence ComEA-like helix-hairpin-helix protein
LIRKISLFLKLTETEFKVLFFLVVTLLAGFGYKTYFLSEVNKNDKIYDYSEQDSLFFSEDNDAAPDFYNNESSKSVDYKREVLDFNTRNFTESKSKSIPEENSINLNTAGIDELTNLPGIGLATAEKIIELRMKRGGFKKLQELLDVKGIGEKKLSNIKKYIFIE